MTSYSMQNIMQFLKRLNDDQNKFVLKREIESIRNQGERVTHLYPNDNYYSHLSIYDFAIQYTRGCNVLDVGSGSGYGCAYLATHGAKKIVGVEQDRNAVRFFIKNFREHLNLQFKQMDAGKLS